MKEVIHDVYGFKKIQTQKESPPRRGVGCLRVSEKQNRVKEGQIRKTKDKID